MSGTEDAPMLPGPAGPAGQQGLTGRQGPTGRAGDSGISRSTKLFYALMIALAVVLGGANLLSGYLQNRHTQQQLTQQNQRFQQQFTQQQEQQAAARQRESDAFDAQLCAIFLPIAQLKAPPGDGTVNPSRLFEQQLESKLALIAPVLRCK